MQSPGGDTEILSKFEDGLVSGGNGGHCDGISEIIIIVT